MVDDVRATLDAAHAAREQSLPACRRVIRTASSSIRAVHRLEPERAAALADEAEAVLREAQHVLDPYPSLVHAGFLSDAEKEYVEARAVAALVEAERLGRQSLAEVRRAVGLLNSGTHGAGAQPLPSLVGLESLVAQYVAAGVRVDLATSGALDAVPATTSLALYRIAEESLANAARHAPGARVAVELGVDRQRAFLRVVNGPGERRAAGAVPAPNDGLGLVGMRQRAELVGGRVVAERAGRGWRVEAEVPLQGAADAP